MKKTVCLLIVLTVIKLSYCQEVYLPKKGEIPKAGFATRIGPMELWMFSDPTSGIKVLNSEAGKDYYGYLTFGEDFIEWELYKKNGKLIVKSLGNNSIGHKFISQGTDKYFKTKYYWSGNTNTFEMSLEVVGCKDDFWCIPKLFFDQVSMNSEGKLDSYITMYYTFDKVK
ncbi:MAG: hypothetical protein FJX30_06165 [Alphaproteobacteria bacterium]|nr:hypothetical protein [Alphaproteobacteria bacterium]